jgi:hypothetical protein
MNQERRMQQMRSNGQACQSGKESDIKTRISTDEYPSQALPAVRMEALSIDFLHVTEARRHHADL